MGASITTQDAVVINLVGQLKVRDEQGHVREVKIGDIIRSGEQLIFTPKAQFNLEYADGTITTQESLADFPDEQYAENASPQAPIYRTPEEEVDAEIAELQAQILAGDDPTLNLPETAAGNAPGNEGNSGFITVSRTGNETLASTGWSTDGVDQPVITAPDAELLTDLSLGAPTISSAEFSIFEANLPLGSDPSALLTQLAANIQTNAEAGIASLTINGVTIISNGEFAGPIVFNTPNGVLTITSFDSATGQFVYDYALSSSVDHSSDDQQQLVFNIELIDGSGNAAAGTITVNIIDDQPLGFADNNSVNEDDAISVTGNLLDNDTQGADLATVTAVTNSQGASVTINGSAVLEGEFGTLTLLNNGSYSYNLDDTAPNVQALGQGEQVTETFNYLLTDSDGDSVLVPLTITITGTNDVPVITVPPGGTPTDGYDAGTVVEAGNLDDGTLVPGIPQVGGMLDATDVDNDAVLTWSGNAAGTYGSFNIDATTGAWIYDLDNDLADSLAEGQSLTETFLVTVTDEFGGTATHNVIITVQGTNDSPIITSTIADATGAVTEYQEDSDTQSGPQTATGTLTATDVDDGAVLTWTTDDTSTYGSFEIDPATGEWTYTLDNAASNSLAEGEQVVEEFLVTVTDEFGATDTQVVTITITGTNDIPVLTVDMIGGVVEDATDPNLTDSGVLSFTDVDVNDTHTVTEQYNGDISWNGGANTDLGSVLTADEINSLIDGFSVDSDSWDYSILNSTVQFLAEGETITLSFDVTVDDGNTNGTDTKTVSITITGTNDTPVLTVDMIGGVTEDATDPNLTDSGVLSFTDVDVNDTHSVTEIYNGDISWNGGANTDLGSVLTADEINSLIDGFSVDNDSWDYSILNSTVQFLAEGETITLSFDVTVDDGNTNGTDTKTVSITITGTNDTPVLNVEMTGGVVEDATDPNLTDSGVLSFTDVDVNDTHNVTEVYNGDISWTGGANTDLGSVLTADEINSLIDGFSVDSDSWDYSILNSTVQFLAEGETITLSFDVTVDDGNTNGTDTKTVSITITGTNDTPVLTVDMIGGVTEDA
ncbi:retention module-containing protein, partial [Shewanella sp. AS1]|uniref:retention module-containing protein n=2 Tax=Shewanella sp. AS1 TaxID=2907626 RepID=UPI001F412B3D